MPIDFDNIDDYVNCGPTPFSPTSVASTLPFSISAWVYPYSNNTPAMIIFDIANNGFGIQLKADNPVGNKLEARVTRRTPTTAYIVTDTSTFSINTLYHIVATFDGSTLTLYVNGSSVGTPVSSASYAIDVDVYMLIGAFGTGGGSAGDNNFDGIINDIAIWDTAISANDVRILYNSKAKLMPLQIKPNNLIAYWPMDDGPDGSSADGDLIRDLSGNGYNGTGDDGANNSGLTWKAECFLSYPYNPILIKTSVLSVLFDAFYTKKINQGIQQSIQFGIR